MTLGDFKKKARRIPDTPGVYYFLGEKKKILYIGKATSLRSRMRSYFSADLSDTRGDRIVAMVRKARRVSWEETDSVLEALIREAHLIQTHKPPYNHDAKDDKSWNFVGITKEDFPRVLLIRGKELSTFSLPLIATFGPFPHGGQLKEALRIVRKMFPFRDTCTPCEKTSPGCKPCFNRQIGLCPGVCSGDIKAEEYRRTIRHIRLFFSGKKKEIVRELTRTMKNLAREERFEEAGSVRKTLFALGHIQDISLIKSEYRDPRAIRAHRIEAYDIAHLAGGAMVGVMTVVAHGEAQKHEYRKFKIRSVKTSHDTAALAEVLERRLGHDEWPLPRLIVVDGGTAQVNAARTTVGRYGIAIPIVGVVKDERHRPKELRGDREHYEGREKDILLANAEAHRFAIAYHRNRRRGIGRRFAD